MGKNSKVISLSFSPPELLNQARERAASLGFKNSFSAYITKLVEDDLSHRASAQLNEKPITSYKAATKKHRGRRSCLDISEE